MRQVQIMQAPRTEKNAVEGVDDVVLSQMKKKYAGSTDIKETMVN